MGENELAEITDSDTAVDSYALTATGQGAGYVTMVFGDGGNPNQQPQGDPVQVQVFKVVPQLYSGDLKVVLSSNPLDEQVSLRLVPILPVILLTTSSSGAGDRCRRARQPTRST